MDQNTVHDVYISFIESKFYFYVNFILFYENFLFRPIAMWPRLAHDEDPLLIVGVTSPQLHLLHRMTRAGDPALPVLIRPDGVKPRIVGGTVQHGASMS